MSLKTNLFRFIFISVLGVLLHFTYEWSGDNAVVGLFSAVNESTWEHLKLLFFPFLLLTILEVLLRGNMLPEQFNVGFTFFMIEHRLALETVPSKLP